MKFLLSIGLILAFGVANANGYYAKIDCRETGLFIKNKTCDVRFSTKIKAPEHYRDLLQLLDSARLGDTIIFHMSGYGGRVDSAIQIINAIKGTKAHTIASVEASVYSAHAFISMAADEIKIKSYVVLMFHHSSFYGRASKVCSEREGQTDRTRSAVVKCEKYFNNSLKNAEGMIKDLLSRVLTAEELSEVLTGYDIYIRGDTLRDRLKALK